MQGKESYPTIKDFVLQEAYEKSFERLVMGLKEYEKEKTKIVGEKKSSLHLEFDKKHKDNNALRRIQKSAKINDSRMQKMHARHDNLKQLIIEAQRRLAKDTCSDNRVYRQLLKKLILEGLIKMLEPVVLVRCLQRDKRVVSDIIGECKQEFRKLIQKQGLDSSLGEVDLKVDDRYVLTLKDIDRNTERVHKSEQSNICFGGVIMTNEDGLIVCKNTLDARLELAHQQMLPTIRRSLYEE